MVAGWTRGGPCNGPVDGPARVRTAVHAAALQLLETHQWDALSVPMVAEASGVHQATIYRRWGSMSALLTDVVNEWSATTAALPDTGSLRDDLQIYAGAVATPLEGRLVPLILRAVVQEIRPGARRQASAAFTERERQLQTMLDRANAQGSRRPPSTSCSSWSWPRCTSTRSSPSRCRPRTPPAWSIGSSTSSPDGAPKGPPRSAVLSRRSGRGVGRGRGTRRAGRCARRRRHWSPCRW